MADGAATRAERAWPPAPVARRRGVDARAQRGRRDAAERRRRWSPPCSGCGGRAACTSRSTPGSPTTRSTTSSTRSSRRRSSRRRAPPLAPRRPGGGARRAARRRRAPPGSPTTRRRRPRAVHLGHHRAAQAGAAHATSGVLELLDGVLGKLRGGRRRPPPTGDAPAGADAEPHPGVAVAVGRHLQRALRVPGRARRSWSWTGFDPAAFAELVQRASASARPCCRRRR